MSISEPAAINGSCQRRVQRSASQVIRENRPLERRADGARAAGRGKPLEDGDNRPAVVVPHGQALLPTLRAGAARQCVVSGSIRELLQRPPLSPRERQVLAMVVLDFSNAEIAEKLVVTESNVKSHLTSAFSKLGVNSRNAAAELILDHESGLGPGILRISPEERAPGPPGAPRTHTIER